jgi:hypothetical protein
MTTEGQFKRCYRKWNTAKHHMFRHVGISENWRRAKYWHRVAHKWREKMQKAKQ